MKLFDVGKIVNTHGLKGEVRVLATTDFSEERFAKGSRLYVVKQNEESVPVIVQTHRRHKNFDLLTFENFHSIQDVEPMVGALLKVHEEDREELNEDEFYYHEIIGLDVIDQETQEKIGKVKEILATGANDVWVVQRNKKRDLLLPYIEDVILDVDVDKGTVTVHVMEGLDDE